jgi:hypothetical protein
LGFTHLDESCLRIPPEFNTTLDFYFRKYLSQEPPDLVIIGLPFVHEGERNTSEVIRLLRILIKQLEEVLPTETDVIWIPQSHSWSPRNGDIGKLNEALYHQLRSRFLDATDRWWGFYNEKAMTAPIGHFGLRADSVHMQWEYYLVAMELFLGLFCSE